MKEEKTEINDKLSEEQKAQLIREKQELAALIGKGFEFTLPIVEYVKPKGLFGILKQPIKTTRIETFYIKEQTFLSLARISNECIEIFIDDSNVELNRYLEFAKQIAHKYNENVIRVIALAIMNQDYFVKKNIRGRFVKVVDSERYDELIGVLSDNLTPSQTAQIFEGINLMMNLSDFMHSIRLMSANRIAAPTELIE